MTSKNSIYKMTLEHLRHSGWMIALSFIGNLLAGPIILLFEYSNRDYQYMRQHYTTEEFLLYKAGAMSSSLSDLCGSMFLGVAMIGALIVTLGIFYYLFQSSKVDLYHSLPLTRKELFYSGYLAGFLIWLVPFIISSVITLPLAIFCAGGFQHINMLLVAFFKMLMIPLFGFIIIFHLCLVAVMLSGNMANAIIAILVWGLAPLAFYGLFTVHFEQYFDTFYQFSINEYFLCGISPIATPIFAQAAQIDDSRGSEFTLLIIIGLLIATLNFFVARALYQKRKSELAGRGMESKAASMLIRIPAAFAAGLFGVIFLYFVGISRNRVVWSLFFCLFFSIFTFAVLSAVQKKTVKGLFAYKMQMLVTVAISMGFLLICRFDVFGYDTYLPDKENIQDAEIRINGMMNYYYNINDDFYQYDNTDVIYELLTACIEPSAYRTATTVVVKINPKNGFSYYRSYYLPVDKVETLRPIVETEDYFSFLYEQYTDSASEFGSMYINDLHRNHFEVENAQQTKELWDAYYADLKEHNTMEELTEYVSVGTIDFFIRENSNSHYYLRELPIHSNFGRTIAYLNEHYPNLVFSKDDLDVEALHVSLILREEMSVEEFYLENLTPTAPTEFEASANRYDESVIIEPVAVSDYTCEFSPEELTWLYEYLHPCQNLMDSLNADSYFYFGELELNTGILLSCYIEKGSMTEEQIQTLAAMVESNKEIITY